MAWEPWVACQAPWLCQAVLEEQEPEQALELAQVPVQVLVLVWAEPVAWVAPVAWVHHSAEWIQ